MGAILMKMAVFFKENTFCVNVFRNHFSMGAILMKMAILLKENASRVNVFLIVIPYLNIDHWSILK